MRRLLVAVPLVGALVACQGGDPAAQPLPTGPAPSTVAAATSAPPTAVTTTTGPVTTPFPTTVATTVATTVPAPSVPVSFTGARDSEWCLRAAELNQLTGAFRRADASDRAAVRDALATILDRIERIERVVPPELARHLSVSAEAFVGLDAALGAVGYDFAAADLAALDARADEIAAANAVIRRYNHDVCGLDAGVTGPEVP